MKLWIASVAWLFAAHFTFGQGSLTPTAPPAPTMRTLQQIEPRTPVQTLSGDAVALHIISEPGSYYLTANINGVSGKSGIRITTGNVTLDLNGFSVIGTNGSGNGIVGTGLRNVVVRNGSVRSWGTAGVTLPTSENVRFSELQTFYNGETGLRGGIMTYVQNCQTFSNASHGIQVGAESTVENCQMRNNAAYGIAGGDGSMFRNCVASFNTQYGIFGQDQCSFIDCIARTNGWAGIRAFDATIVKNCLVAGNGGTNNSGIELESSANIEGCIALGNGWAGIYVAQYGTIKNSSSSFNNRFGFFSGKGCVIAHCTAGTNTMSGFSLSGPESLLRDCTSVGNVGGGVQVSANSQILNNNVSYNLSHGITTTFSNSRFEGNTVVSNQGNGLFLFGTNNFAIRNSGRGNSANNFSMGSGNHYGPIITSPGAAFTNSNPWSNFQF